VVLEPAALVLQALVALLVLAVLLVRAAATVAKETLHRSTRSPR
jgi:hypothetical protein